ncbi:hypothetical protein [Mangrovibacterium marinum]|uniref:hypothetical protein n=1 Tax=Mangrovibacterium marinum TaxID=1639118 RepID=UPI002A18C47E|nr:hypothetical protein [Mangrovibacterium marinum]
MKKLGKLTLKKMQKEMPFISRSDAQMILGGQRTDDYGIIWYTQSEMNSMVSGGNWNGGYVDGLGYVAQTITYTYDSPNTELMTLNELIASKKESYNSLFIDALGSAVCDWNPVTSYLYDGASTYDEVMRIKRTNAFLEALIAINNSGYDGGQLTVTSTCNNFTISYGDNIIYTTVNQ